MISLAGIRVKKFIQKAVMVLCASALLTSCVTTYNTTAVDVISDSPDDNSIHFVKKTENIKANNTIDGKLLAYYTLGYPFVVLGCTVRETARVAGYSAMNLILGVFAYDELFHGDGNVSGFALPNTKKPKEELAQFQKEYEASDLYKYRKYRKALHKATITKQDLVEEVNWNDEAKLISSSTETIKCQTDIGKSAKQVSKKASLVGGRIGTVTSVIFGIPSYIVGVAAGAYLDASGN